MNTALTNAIVALAQSQPGLTTNAIYRELRTLKTDVLVELEQLHEKRVLRYENGQRGSHCWYLVRGREDQFPTRSGERSASTGDGRAAAAECK